MMNMFIFILNQIPSAGILSSKTYSIKIFPENFKIYYGAGKITLLNL